MPISSGSGWNGTDSRVSSTRLFFCSSRQVAFVWDGFWAAGGRWLGVGDGFGAARYQRSSHAEAVQDESASAVSTAEARPNAYIPDDIGIPKPYGGMAPFKPSEPGSSMRHIVKPQPREIQI